MAEMLNPGVYLQEVNASVIAPTVSTSTGVFGGNFIKGPVGVETPITSVTDLLTFYGGPTNANYNDFFQAYNFLQYSNKLLLSRASNVVGTGTAIINGVVAAAVVAASPTVSPVISVNTGATYTVNNLVAFDSAAGAVDLTTVYKIIAVDNVLNTITLDRNPTNDIAINSLIYDVIRSINAGAEAVTTASPQVTANQQFGALVLAENYSDYSMKMPSITTAGANTKYKFTARNPGAWANGVEICIANPDAFGGVSEAFTGISLDSLYEYPPTGNEIAIVIRDNLNVVETHLVSSIPSAKDYNNKSIYIENVLNSISKYVFVKDNLLVPGVSTNYCAVVDTAAVGGVARTIGSNLILTQGTDSAIQADDLLNAYSIFDNKESVEIDIVIANELDGGASAKALTDARLDCIGFVGANYSDTVGKRAAVVTSNLINWRKSTGLLGLNNISSMFMVACGNYKYQYDRYNDVYRWINIAGDVAGLRAATSSSRASWWASAGLERGVIKNITRLAFNPTSGMRDLLYKVAINPIVSFPGQGTVMWGQKTLTSKPSSFDRVNVRGLFNTLERALSKMAKYQVMEFNDNFTRNRIISMIKPYLDTVQSGRGIQDFLVICDESNNTPDVISRNQLVIDVYIKPTYVAEFIQLKFTNAGTNSFTQVIGA